MKTSIHNVQSNLCLKKSQVLKFFVYNLSTIISESSQNQHSNTCRSLFFFQGTSASRMIVCFGPYSWCTLGGVKQDGCSLRRLACPRECIMFFIFQFLLHNPLMYMCRVEHMSGSFLLRKDSGRL